MRTGNEVPVVRSGTTVLEATREITKKHIGMTAVVDNDNKVLGIFTEGDLRRLIEQRGDIRGVKIDEVMTSTPLRSHRKPWLLPPLRSSTIA